jgi:hypothetical protein
MIQVCMEWRENMGDRVRGNTAKAQAHGKNTSLSPHRRKAVERRG